MLLKERKKRMKRIRTEFNRRKWTITHMMRVSGLSYPTVFYSIGKKSIPFIGSIEKMEKALGILENL